MRTVSLVGDFNSWKVGKDQLTLVEPPDLWALSRHFEGTGAFLYKFVLNRREWVDDPENLNRDQDGYGGYNSRVVVLV